MNKIRFVFILLIPLTIAFSSYSCKIAVLKYNGGGDWYANPTSLNNLIKFCQANLNMNINPIYDVVNRRFAAFSSLLEAIKAKEDPKNNSIYFNISRNKIKDIDFIKM